MGFQFPGLQSEEENGERSQCHTVGDGENRPGGLASWSKSGPAEHGKSYLWVISRAVDIILSGN